MQLLTKQEVADRLGITVRTLDNWRADGRAPRFLEVNGSIRCREDDLEDWIERQPEVGTDNS